MNMLHRHTGGAVGAVCVVDGLAALDAFLEQGCAAAIWRRQVPQKVQKWLDALDPETLPCGRVVLPVHAVEKALHQLFEMSDLPRGTERDYLQADIVALADAFSGLMSARYLRLRLDVVTTNACRKFHLDAITGRLVCTYRGTGTQYGFSQAGADPDRVFTVPTGAPVLLRGSLWPARPVHNLLHRCPPIEGSGETRLVLVLDPLSEACDET